MKNEPKDQESFFDEIMDRINAIQQDQMIEESKKFIEQCASRQEAEKAQQNVVDQEIFNEVKNASKDAAVKEKSPIRRLLEKTITTRKKNSRFIPHFLMMNRMILKILNRQKKEMRFIAI